MEVGVHFDMSKFDARRSVQLNKKCASSHGFRITEGGTAWSNKASGTDGSQRRLLKIFLPKNRRRVSAGLLGIEVAFPRSEDVIKAVPSELTARLRDCPKPHPASFPSLTNVR